MDKWEKYYIITDLAKSLTIVALLGYGILNNVNELKYDEKIYKIRMDQLNSNNNEHSEELIRKYNELRDNWNPFD